MEKLSNHWIDEGCRELILRNYKKAIVESGLLIGLGIFVFKKALKYYVIAQRYDMGIKLLDDIVNMYEQ